METSEEFALEPWSPSTSSAAGSLARTSATQASAQASTASGRAYGQSTPELLASYDPATSSWRTSQLCLDGDLSEFSETWPRSGLMRSGIAYRLPPLVPLTAETGFGLLPTPRADERSQGEGAALAYAEAGFKQPTTRNAMRMWPTPDAYPRGGPQDAEKRKAGGHSVSLQDAVHSARMWPTPVVTDAIGARNKTSRRTKADESTHNSGTTLTDAMIDAGNLSLETDASGSNRVIGGSLNPTWVEWLMGFPLGWTALDASETPSSRKSQKSSDAQS